ncbi:hypothetical protein BDQ17DRAFT_1232794 [Cyathus striatus]|nr:hypothetical protein BDQ17DRAFT_1232794 [Cyathus striatus]
MLDEHRYSSSPSKSPGPRRLPLPPVPPSARRVSRPLPQIPKALVCKKCQTCITSHNVSLPSKLIPPNARSFRGFIGMASLFMETYNVSLSRPRVQLMATGAHTMQEISCATCTAYMGWKIVRAHEPSEKWKEGHCLLELENLQSPTHGRPASSSDTESDYSF